MKLIRTTTPINYGRKGREIILCMSINIEWQEDKNRWLVNIKDYEQKTIEAPAPGTALYIYEPLRQENGSEYDKKIRTAEEVNALFSYFNISILPSDNFTDKFRQVLALAAIYENQVSPPYTINPADLEIIDTTTEIAPEI